LTRGSLPIFLIGSLGLVVLLFAGLRPLFLANFEPGAVGSLFYGLAACFLVVTGSYFLLRRAVDASNQSFLAAFVGGILGRLFLFAAVVAIAFVADGLNGRAAAVAILAGFLPLTALEVWCVLREAGRKKGKAAAAASAESAIESDDG
jgi:hypothetical protein